MPHASGATLRAHQTRLLLTACLVATGACATTPLNRRTAMIGDADQQAKLALASENKIDAAKIPARSFAVLPFTVAERDTLLTPLGFGIADLLSSDLTRSPQLHLVERLHTDAILRELDLVDAGVTDPRSAPRVGKLMGARRLLIGSIMTPRPGTVRLNARVVDVISGTVQELTTADAPLDRIVDAEKELALLLFERLGITLTPAQRTLVEQKQTTQLAAVVAYGRGVDADAHGDVAAALAAYSDAARIDVTFSAARSQSVAAAPASQQSRSTAVQRVMDLSTTAINQPVATRIPEAVDTPLTTSLMIALLITIRVTP
jgi:curli biogenesis system outer membrane secretion channel CsgG